MLFTVLFACLPIDGPRQKALDDAQARWDAEAPSHYRYVEDEWAFAPFDGPVRIEVQDGEIVYALIVESDQPAPESRALTIEDLFDKVQDALDGRPDDIEIEYDGELGFPASVDVDPIENAMDDEHGFSAEQFENLE
jgi:hypothetical protein